MTDVQMLREPEGGRTRKDGSRQRLLLTNTRVGNGLRGHHFCGEAGTSPKQLRFGQVVPGRVS
jgi:hypothetical protein